MKRLFVFVALLLGLGVVSVAFKLNMLPFQAPALVAGPVLVESMDDQGVTLPSTDEQLPAVSAAQVPYKLTVIAEGLEVPWGLAFTNPDRLLVTERPGRVRVITAGKLQPKPLLTLADVSNDDEEGLMGIVLDPDYQTTSWVYLCYAYQTDAGLATKVIRAVDRGDALVPDKTLLEAVPAARFHAGCALTFGPDGNLYISTGDATQKELAQDLSSLAGKILRVTSDGSIPTDNPFPNSAVWSYGHRNPQGLVWNTTTSTLYSVEHGPSGFDGPGGGDEVNVILPGGNYGWPLVSHTETLAGTEQPKIVYTPAIAPATAMVYQGTAFPAFMNNLFFTALKGEALVRVVFDQNDPTKVVFYEKMPGVELGRLRAVVEAPDGSIYVSTSNRDGRGQPRVGNDTIFSITPQ